MDLNEPYNTNQPRHSRGRGINKNNNNNAAPASHEVPLGMVIDRTSRLHIANIPLDVIEAEGNEALKSEFAAFGHVDRYVLFSDRTGRFTGGAMCTFRNPADAREAMKALNGRENSDGTKLKVSIAQEHGVVLMRDLKAQRWEQQEARNRGDEASALGAEEEAPGADIGARDRTKKGYNPDGSWSHDMFDRIQRGEAVRWRGGYRGPDFYANRERNQSNNGGRGGFRGRGGANSTIDARFEQYIQQRDGMNVDGMAMGGIVPAPMGMGMAPGVPMMMGGDGAVPMMAPVVAMPPMMMGQPPLPMMAMDPSAGPAMMAMGAVVPPAPTMFAAPAADLVTASFGVPVVSTMDGGVNNFAGDMPMV